MRPDCGVSVRLRAADRPSEWSEKAAARAGTRECGGAAECRMFREIRSGRLARWRGPGARFPDAREARVRRSREWAQDCPGGHEFFREKWDEQNRRARLLLRRRNRLKVWAVRHVELPRCELLRVLRRAARGSACGLKPAAQPEFAGLELESGVVFGATRLIGIAREGVNREGIPVEVIFQIEDAGKTCAGEIRLAPGAVFPLLMDEIRNGFGDRGVVDVIAGEKPDETPSALRSGARALAFRERLVIAAQGFAEAAVGLLHGAKQGDGTLAVIARCERNGLERAQDAAAAVNVVHAPAAEPGAVFGLILEKKFYGALDGGMLGRPAETAKTFDNAGGDVGGRRIDHGVVVGERNVAEEAAVIVAIKRAPAAIAILHAEKPLDAAANGAFHAGRIGIFYALERHQDEGGVVDVGIKIIAEFERPAAGLGVFVLDLPVAGTEDLLRKHPVRGFDQRGMIGGKTGFLERNHGDASIPDGGNAGLHSNGVAVFDFEPREFLDFAPG